MSQIEVIKNEITAELSNKQVLVDLLSTTFKGLNEMNARKALFEGMIRGFKFNDFLSKNIYAIPFSTGYSLVTSIDYARKIGSRSGVSGKSEPVYVEKDDKIEKCSVTIYKKGGDERGFTATVYFNEYYKAGKNGYPSLWDTKPRTMIAKVAEMHALRMACPEELSQLYAEEELDQEKRETPINLEEGEKSLKEASNLEELQKAWAALPVLAKNNPDLEKIKDQLKAKFLTSDENN